MARISEQQSIDSPSPYLDHDLVVGLDAASVINASLHALSHHTIPIPSQFTSDFLLLTRPSNQISQMGLIRRTALLRHCLRSALLVIGLSLSHSP